MSHNSRSMPYIKSEPDEFGNNPNRFMQAPSYGGNQQNFNAQFHNQQHGQSIDPSQLSMSNSGFGVPYSFNTQNMSSSFNMGGAAYGEDELLESLDFTGNDQGLMDEFTNINPSHNASRGPGPISMSHPGQMTNPYSSTPDGPPIQSPFLGTFDYSQFRSMNSVPQHMSPNQNPQFMSGKRPSIQASARKTSELRSPLTPRTAAMANLHIGTPEMGSLANGRAVSIQNRHQKSVSGQYDSTPGSLHSYLDSPLSSPPNNVQHPNISEAFSAKHASLPAKVENGLGSGTGQSMETVEAKKRRRRASHNAVERRRRDNINERIQDLSHLVPQHRLEDDRVRKQLSSNGPLSPTIGATSMSPPNTGTATSLLAGAGGRRATSTAGNITIGLPIEEKEKGPNKGDILNGGVSWTRDLMWALYQKYQQEEELAQYITSINGTWPFQITEDEKRMRSEVFDAMERNDPSTFSYSRADGSGLRVPKHTNLAGDRLAVNQSTSPSSNFELSPGFHSGGSGTNSSNNNTTAAGQTQYWHSAGHGGISFKEEDEFMDLN